MDDLDVNLLRGTLDLLILKALSWGPRARLRRGRMDRAGHRHRLPIGEGNLDPALHRLEGRGWVTAEWGVSDNNRQAKYYRLARAGRARLQAGTSSWHRFVEVAGRALRAAAAGARLMASFRLNLGPRRVERDVDAEPRLPSRPAGAAAGGAGQEPAAARAEALRQFGDWAGVRGEPVAMDTQREKTVRRAHFLAELRQDTAYAARALRYNLGFSLVSCCPWPSGSAPTRPSSR